MKVLRFACLVWRFLFATATVTITLRQEPDNRIRATFEGTLDLSERDDFGEEDLLPFFYFRKDISGATVAFDATFGGPTVCSYYDLPFVFHDACLGSLYTTIRPADIAPESTLSSGISLFLPPKYPVVHICVQVNATEVSFPAGESIVFRHENLARRGLLEGSKCSFEIGEKAKVEIIVEPVEMIVEPSCSDLFWLWIPVCFLWTLPKRDE